MTNTEAEEKALNREKRVRNKEIALAVLLIILVSLGAWGQTTYFASDSWYFIGLLNLNAILLLVISYLAIRNVIKLIAERRRKVFGSKLRTRLMLAFISLSLIPVFLMFLAANRVVIKGIDYWFTSTVENSMSAALEVGQSFYIASIDRLTERIAYLDEQISPIIVKTVEESATLPYFEHEENSNKRDIEITETIEINKDKKIEDITQEVNKSDVLDPVLLAQNKVKAIEKYLLSQEGLLRGNILILFEASEHAPYARYTFAAPHNKTTSQVVQRLLQSISWKEVTTTPYSSIIPLESTDYAVSMQKLFSMPSHYIILAENIGNTSYSKLSSISKGFEEYTYLKSLRKPLRLSFSLILAILGLIMIFSSIFMAIRLSKELTAPIEALAKGSDRITQGELDFILEDKGKDELSQLVHSFNSMTKHVKTSNEEIKQANNNLEQRNLFIETVLENIATGVLVLDSQGKVLTINKAASRMFEMRIENWKNRYLAQYFQGNELHAYIEMMTALKSFPEQIWKKEMDITFNAQTVKILITALYIPYSTNETPKDEEGIIIAVIEDLTELVHAEKLAAWREVAKRITHEMKNPLTPIRLSAERLERKFNTDEGNPVFSECTQLIINEVNRMQAMIKNFKEFAQVPETKLRSENIVSLVNDSLRLFKTSHPSITWIYEGPFEDIPSVLLDKISFRQALINIYLNAAEIIEEKTEEENKKQQALVHTKLEFSEDNCLIVIADNALTLPKESLSRLFDPYYTKKKDGTGLGLAIVQSIIKEHNAHIYAENNELGGTSICISIPINKNFEA